MGESSATSGPPGGNGLMGELSATVGPPGGSGLMGVVSECPTARIAKEAPKDRLRKHNDLENMRVDSFCCEIGHFTARVTLNAHFV